MNGLKAVKAFFVFFICVILISCVKIEVQAEEGIYNGLVYHYAPEFYYENYGDADKNKNYAVLFQSIIIVDYVGTKSEVIVPANINGIPVTALSEGCFSFNTNIEKVVIENPHTVLESGVFMGCKNLKEVVLPKEITEIPDRAFAYCTKLEKIKIPCWYANIREFAFYKCTKLKKVEFGEDGLLNVGNVSAEDSSFEGCKNLEQIELGCFGGIGRNAFRGCKSLKNIRLRTRNIFEGAFSNCTGLKKVTIEWGWRDQNNKNIFRGCKNLKNILFENDPPEKIYPGTFKGIHKKAVLRIRYEHKKELKRMLTKETGFKKTMKVRGW